MKARQSGGTDRGDALPVRVMQGFVPTAQTNPYLLELADALASEVDVLTFSWRLAMQGRYHVLHIHWPEVFLRGTTPVRSVARTLMTLSVLLVARCRRRVIVRTLHNVEPHEQLDLLRSAIVRLFDRWTTAWITLTGTITPPGPAVVIPHGHYRRWFAAYPRAVRIPGRVLFFGHLRRYKGIEDLLAAAASVTHTPFSLRIVGAPRDDLVRSEVTSVANEVGHITAHLGYATDEELAREITQAELVVLPYRTMVNSGAALLALSLDRPILVPATPSTEELRGEVGARWVHTYHGTLSPEVLVGALADAAQVVTAGQTADLSRREWDKLARDHAALYRTALAANTRSRPKRWVSCG